MQKLATGEVRICTEKSEQVRFTVVNFAFLDFCTPHKCYH